MSSDNRASSAVRNLRSLFENKGPESNTSDARGRSPNGVGSDKENGHRPKSKIRASFVAVEPVTSMSTTRTERRGSFGEADGDLALRKTISEQQGQLNVPEAAMESVSPSAVGTPTRTEGPNLGHVFNFLNNHEDEPPDNPDKPVTGAEEESSDMKPAEPSNEAAVSGGVALPPVAEYLRPNGKSAASKKSADKPVPKTTASSSKPAAISTTKASTKAATISLKSPASQPKTPISAKAPSLTSSPVARKASRTSLAAPTASSMARSGPSDKAPSTKTSPTSSKPKPREGTKPISLPSHLTAPTASSKAKYEPDSMPTPAPRTSTNSKPKPTTTPAKPTQRASLAAAQRPVSRDPTAPARRSLAPVDGSFLDRMTRPTASSASRTTEKVEAKSPPRSKASGKPKVNGHTSKSVSKSAAERTDAVAGAEPKTNGLDDAAGLSFAGGANSIEDAIAATDVQANGTETPNHTNGEPNVALEATPAGLGSEEMIR